MSFGNEYLKVVQERFKSVKGLGDKTISRLSEDDIHWVLNDGSNSVAVIVKHVSGNMVSRWSDFLTSDGEKSYRNRVQEFENNVLPKQDLITIWDEGWNVLFDTLNDLEEQDLLKNINIRSDSHTVVDAIERQMAHYAYHIGQIVFIGKQLKNGDWKSLSIPKGQSEEYLQRMQEIHKENNL